MKKLTLILIALLTVLNILNAQTTKWNEFSLKSHWRKNGIDEIEGIYKIMNSNSRSAIIKINNVYHQYNLDKREFNGIIIEEAGRLEAILKPTATQNLFNAKSYLLDGSTSEAILISFENGMMHLYNTETDYKVTFIKLFPSVNDNIPSSTLPKKELVSGTGFCISSNGIIVTNHHVIENANSIKVKGINSDFNTVYKAKVLVSDKNNDLALIQINDYKFNSIIAIPYTIKTSLAGVGENIFVLGYPLRASMGDEIKLTNGIISSKTGFQGDISSYQISAPVQPGNSGGPLFDSQGNLIGIINAKHIGAENASYAVKASYLTNLLDLLQNPPNLQTVNSLTGKTLPQQVEVVKKIVYIIESE